MPKLLKKMKRTNIIYIVLGILLFNTSCIYTKMSHLTDEDLIWINCADSGRVQYFESDRGMCVKTTYVDRKIHNQKSRIPDNIWHVINVSSEYNANASYRIRIYQGSRITELSFLIVKPVDSISPRISIHFANTSFRNSLPDTLSSIAIGGNVYEDCLIMNEDNYENSPKDNDNIRISEYGLSKRYGLIYYKLEDGETFYLKRSGNDWDAVNQQADETASDIPR